MAQGSLGNQAGRIGAPEVEFYVSKPREFVDDLIFCECEPLSRSRGKDANQLFGRRGFRRPI